MTREDAIRNAWNKISEYIKENYSGVFSNGIEFEWKHEVYYKIKFGVTSDGIAYFARGSHGWSYDEWYYHPIKKECYVTRLLSITEEVVQDWGKIKARLEREAERENKLYNFEV